MTNASVAMRREQRMLAIHIINALANDARTARLRLGPERQIEAQAYRTVMEFLSEKDSRWIETTLDMYSPGIDLTIAEEELAPVEQMLRHRGRPDPQADNIRDRVRKALAVLRGRIK